MFILFNGEFRLISLIGSWCVLPKWLRCSKAHGTVSETSLISAQSLSACQMLGPIGLWSNIVHYVGYRVPFGTDPQCLFSSVKAEWLQLWSGGFHKDLNPNMNYSQKPEGKFKNRMKYEEKKNRKKASGCLRQVSSLDWVEGGCLQLLFHHTHSWIRTDIITCILVCNVDACAAGTVHIYSVDMLSCS